MTKQLSLFEHCTEPSKPKTKKGHKWELFVDGAARRNPGIAGAGVVIKKNGELIKKKGFFLGHKTNNQAEYFGLLLGIFYVRKLVDVEDIIYVLADSELLIKQMKGEYRVKDVHLKKLFELAWILLANQRYSFCHIKREYNAQADAAANEGIDKKISLPHEFVKILDEHAIDF
jgi:ribonuclease HI